MRKLDIEQGSYEWHCERQGRVTGTTLASALGTAKVQATLRHKLVAERMTEPLIEDLNTPAIAKGREMEPHARRAVIEKTGINFVETGMLIDSEIEHFALSPDAIYEEDGIVKGGLEIKCPNSKKHVEYLLSDAVPKEYFHQVIAPFVMSESVEWWDFASFDDRNYERPLSILRVNRPKNEIISEYREKLINFLKTVNDAHIKLTF